MKAKMPYIFVYRGDEHENNDRMRQCVCVCVCVRVWNLAQLTERDKQRNHIRLTDEARGGGPNPTKSQNYSRSQQLGKNKYLKILLEARTSI